MSISKEEAQAALNEISTAMDLTRKSIAEGVAAPLLIMWGVIWAICYSTTQFTPQHSSIAWGIGVGVGTIASWGLGTFIQPTVKSPNDYKIGMFWLALFAFAGIWLFLLLPIGLNVNGPAGTNVDLLFQRKIGAFFATVPMFGYVVGGIWMGRFFVVLGILVTVLTLAGYVLLPDWFNLWMAVTGGGSLIISGVFIRRFWK